MVKYHVNEEGNDSKTVFLCMIANEIAELVKEIQGLRKDLQTKGVATYHVP